MWNEELEVDVEAEQQNTMQQLRVDHVYDAARWTQLITRREIEKFASRNTHRSRLISVPVRPAKNLF